MILRNAPARLLNRRSSARRYVCLREVKQLTGRAAEAVELGHHDDVAGLEPRHQLGQLRPVGANAAYLFTFGRRGGAGRLGGDEAARVHIPCRQCGGVFN